MQEQVLEIIDEQTGEFLARIRVTRPVCGQSEGTACVMINSGRVGSFDGTQDEVKLFDDVRAALGERGVACFEIDLPDRGGENEIGGELIALRLRRVRRMLFHPEFLPYRERYTFLALSLGGQVVLRYLASIEINAPVPVRAVLISTVIECPIVVQLPVAVINLLFGENDFVGYITPDEANVKLLSPHAYAGQSLDRLVVRRSQQVTCHILRGCGHILNSVMPQAADAREYLVDLIAPLVPANAPAAIDAVQISCR
ncbi:hypothetical protein MRBLMS1_000367 [Massilia sp. LMS1-1-1.1]